MLEYGDRVSLKGRLLSPSNTARLPWRDILANRGIGSEMRFPRLISLGSTESGPLGWIMTIRRRLLCCLALVAGAGLVCLALTTAPRPAYGYVEAGHSLGQVITLSSNVVLVRVEKVDKEKNLLIYRKVRDIKGTHPTDVIKHAIGRGGYNPRDFQFAGHINF